jgi:hypothetical protein
MYRYDEFDAEFVRQRVAQFRDQVNRRQEDEFKPLRLMNGVYLQLHAYMLRAALGANVGRFAAAFTVVFALSYTLQGDAVLAGVTRAASSLHPRRAGLRLADSVHLRRP